MTGYRTCADCPAPVKFRDRVRCHVCHRRVTRAALKRPCPHCGQVRHLGESGACAICGRGAVPGRPARIITCARCGEQRQHASHGLCNRCSLADPDRPFRYAAAAARRLRQVPDWWEDLAAFAAARHHPGGAIEILREAGRLLAADPAASPAQLLDRCEPANGTAGRALRRFFTSRGLALPGDEEQRRAAARRRRHLDAVPACLAAAVAAFNDSQLARAGPSPARRPAPGQRHHRGDQAPDPPRPGRPPDIRRAGDRLVPGDHHRPRSIPRPQPRQQPPPENLRAARLLPLGETPQAHPHRPGHLLAAGQPAGLHRHRP